MFVNCTFQIQGINSPDLKKILKQLTQLGIDMSKVQEAIQAAMAQQDLVLSAAQTLSLLAEDIKQKLNENDVVGAQELLNKIQENNVVLANAIVAGTDAAHLGDPTVLDAVVNTTDTADTADTADTTVQEDTALA